MKSTNDQRLQIRKDIAVLQAYRRGRVEFNELIVEASNDKSDNVLGLLRSDAMFQIAEFYFLLLGFGINSTDEFDGLIERHNNYIALLLKDSKKMSRMGLTKERLLGSIFDGETRPRVLGVWNESPGTIDQSSLARLLVTVMSDETARKAVVAAEKAGFLSRERSFYRLVLVRSTGVLEHIYGKCLRMVRLSIEDQHNTKSSQMAGRYTENKERNLRDGLESV